MKRETEGRLCPEELTGAGTVVGSHLLCLDCVDSTNTYLKEQAARGAPHGLVVTAEEQTGGRGRMGREFVCHRGKGLYLSVLLRPQMAVVQAGGLTAWIAVAVYRALEKLIGLAPEIKWINDILLDGKKVCGILTELGIDSSDQTPYIVIGIGVNVSQMPQDFPSEVAQIATSLKMHMPDGPTREALARALIEELDRMWADFPHRQDAYWQEYKSRCTTLGRQVELITPAGRRSGFARALGRDFRLEVVFENGDVQWVDSGEISARPRN